MQINYVPRNNDELGNYSAEAKQIHKTKANMKQTAITV